MLKNVKSKYILNIFFSYLDVRQKLKILKYNKSLQKDMDISLINYKFFSNKYIILEENVEGEGYEVLFDTVSYEGNFLHGERNGKGKECHIFGKLIFEREYLKGKRTDKEKNIAIFGIDWCLKVNI